MLIKLCKTWTSENFSPASLDRCKNKAIKYFDLKIWTQKDMMLDFRQRETIYKLSYCLNNYPLKFNGGHFFGTPVCACII
jgi:hypothetical protein